MLVAFTIFMMFAVRALTLNHGTYVSTSKTAESPTPSVDGVIRSTFTAFRRSPPCFSGG